MRAPQSQVDIDFVLGVSGAFIHRHLAHHAFRVCDRVLQFSVVFSQLFVQEPSFFKFSLHFFQLNLFLAFIFFFFHRFSLFFAFCRRSCFCWNFSIFCFFLSLQILELLFTRTIVRKLARILFTTISQVVSATLTIFFHFFEVDTIDMRSFAFITIFANSSNEEWAWCSFKFVSSNPFFFFFTGAWVWLSCNFRLFWGWNWC